ncbi:facilitated trehalose transporter Tret1-like isoform X1 [Danaus plexippus]|uniref:facilitated trehalose transporter Tret1-like isoform X1 n=1 Tax=Danaus plexippus TaxID=13037 RepID=UPI002AB02C55|nr:facilitated trehalose transporter Tret1-like isoform X1 [Danaus plexippus]
MKGKLSSALIRQFTIATLVNLVSLTAGVSMLWSSPMLVKLRNGTDTPLSRPITQEEGSWIVSGGYLVACITNLLAGTLLDKIGRKYSIILITIPRICASIWTIFVTEVWMLIFCRMVMVSTDNYIYVVIPVYVSEIANVSIAFKEFRASLGTFLHILACIGIVATLSIGPFVSYTIYNCLVAGVIVLTSIPLLFLPESPVHLYTTGRTDDAINVLSKVRETDVQVKQEIEDYKSSKKEKIAKLALMKDKTFLKSLSLGILVCGGCNAVGYNAVEFYLQTILEATHSSLMPEVASVIVGCIQLSAAVCTSFFTKMFGRRPILIYSLIGMLCGMLGLGVFFTYSTREGYVISGFLNYLPIISLILATYSFNIGIGCLLFIVTVELFEGRTRAFGYTICFTFFLLSAFITTKYLEAMFHAFGYSGTYWFFSAMCLIICTLIVLFVPETKGKTITEIQIALGNKKIEAEVGNK